MKKVMWIGLIMLMASCATQTEQPVEVVRFPFEATARQVRDLDITNAQVRYLNDSMQQYIYQVDDWMGMSGTLTYYVESNQIRSIAFAPTKNPHTREQMLPLMQLLYGDNREADITTLRSWYERDGKGRYSAQAKAPYDMGERINSFWLQDGWVIATHNGTFPYQFIAFVPTNRFNFALEDYTR
jgi:hypothetical protein